MTVELAKKRMRRRRTAACRRAYGRRNERRCGGETTHIPAGRAHRSAAKTYSQLGGAVGYKAETDSGPAGGYNARTAETIDVGNGATNYSRITAVQLERGLNSKDTRRRFFDYELVADDAEIPPNPTAANTLKT